MHQKLPQSTVKVVLPSSESYESKTGCNRTLATVLWAPLTLVAHDCRHPLLRYTCRATRVAADFLNFIAFCRCSRGIAPHPPKILVSHLSPSPRYSCGCRATLCIFVPHHVCHCNWSGRGVGLRGEFSPQSHLDPAARSPQIHLDFTSNSPRFTSKPPQTNLRVIVPSYVSSRGNVHPRFKRTSRC